MSPNWNLAAKVNKPAMKTASLGLLEVMVVRVNDEGDAPPDPPLLVTSRAIPPFFVFLKNRFLANERENIFGGLTVKIELQETLPNKWRA